MRPTVVIPIRHFDGFTRLEPVLSPTERRIVAVELADRLRRATAAAGVRARVVSADPDVRAWADEHDVEWMPDPGRGLNAACETGTEGLSPWVVVHADLPGIRPEDIAALLERAAGGVVIAPSADGGTNAIGAPHPIPFRFGPGSFHRHLAGHPTAAVLAGARVCIEVDTPEHLANLPSDWPAPSLGLR